MIPLIMIECEISSVVFVVLEYCDFHYFVSKIDSFIIPIKNKNMSRSIIRVYKISKRSRGWQRKTPTTPVK